MAANPPLAGDTILAATDWRRRTSCIRQIAKGNYSFYCLLEHSIATFRGCLCGQLFFKSVYRFFFSQETDVSSECGKRCTQPLPAERKFGSAVKLMVCGDVYVVLLCNGGDALGGRYYLYCRRPRWRCGCAAVTRSRTGTAWTKKKGGCELGGWCVCAECRLQQCCRGRTKINGTERCVWCGDLCFTGAR